MTVDYSPTPPTPNTSRGSGTTEVQRWTNLGDTLADADSRITADAAALADHLADTADAHDASAVSVAATPTNYTAATPDVEAHLAGIDAELAGGGGGASGAWTAYTPTWTAVGSNPSLGNGTIVGGYRTDGKTLFIRIQLITGSTTTYGSGEWRFSLPTGVTSSGQRMPLAASAFDSSSSARKAGSAQCGPSAAEMLVILDAVVTSAVPWTWATGDQLLICGVMEIT